MASTQGKPTPVKGILKKTNKTPTSTTTSSTTSSATAAAAATKKPDPREIAIKHAQIIHDRRALEDTITDSIILLSKLPDIPSATTSTSEPASTSTSAASPPSASENTTTAADAEAAAALFKSHIRLFQPSDYDALIEERNAQGRCGYALCPNPRRRLPPGTGAFKILNFGRSDFAIVPRAEAERWCAGGGGSSSKGKGDGKGKGSSGGTVTCARRAMYVRVQLLETAAWERAGIESIAIELLEEVEAERQQLQNHHPTTNDTNEEEEESQARKRQQDRERKDEAERLQKAARDARDLAMERGDASPTTPNAKAPPGKKGQQKQRNIKVAIREKTVVVGPVREPTLDEGRDQHLLLDGYKTKFDPKSESMSKGTTITTTRKDDLAADADAADVDTTPAAAASTSATTSVEDKSTTAE